MKKIILASAFVILPFTCLFAQLVALPNDDFKTFLRNTYSTCFSYDATSNDYLLDTTCLLIRNEDSLTVQSLGTWSNRISLDPLRYFTSLNYFFANSLDVIQCPPFPQTLEYLVYKSIRGTDLLGLPNSLKYLDCSADSLTMSSITHFPDSLRYLKCSWNPVTAFPSLVNTQLDTLICFLMYGDDRTAQNTLRSLPALPATLKYLDCSQNALDSLPVLPNGLEYLDCKLNFYESPSGADTRTLTQLPILPSSLKTLICGNNRLSALPQLPGGLVYLDCGYTNLGADIGLTSLPPLPASLVYLTCSQNSLTNLPDLPNRLEYLNIGANDIISIDRFPDSLKYFYANANHSLTSIPALPSQLSYLSVILTDLTCMPHLPASMGGSSPYNSPTNLNFLYNSNKIHCLPNLVNGIRPNQSSPLCTVTNNSNQCQISPVITGKVFYDLDGDGIKGTNELYKTNVLFTIDNSVFTMSNDSGFYNISADTGLHVLRINAGSVFSSIPDTFVYNFSNYDTTVTLDIPLRSVTVIDSLKISLTALNSARPGFPLHYHVRYENTGSTILPTNMLIDFDESRLDFDSVNNPAVTNSSGQLSAAVGNLLPGQIGDFVASFTLRPTAILGDSLVCLATIIAPSFEDSIRTAVLIGGSFDPNDKNATPVLTPLQVDNGAYIDYVIRFQNTGTDTAFNIVVTDTLSQFLDAETFELVNTSHPCKVTRVANTVSFEFLNILLPDSNRNELQSHGFIRFRMKAFPGMVVNTVIPNDASIYFDYNSPIVTNTTNTTIQTIATCITVDNTITNPVCTQQNGSIAVNVSGGTPPFLYSINGGPMQSNPVFTGLGAGTYLILVHDAGACTHSEAVTVNPQSGIITPTISVNSSANTICAGDDVTFTAVGTGGGANPQYQWIVNGANSGTGMATLTLNPVANTEVSIQFTSSDPCASPTTVGSNSVIVTVNPSLNAVITIAGDTTVTQGQGNLISATATNGGNAPAYQWQDSITPGVWNNIAGATGSSLDYLPQHTGVGLRCELITTATCISSPSVLSNVLIFTVDPSSVLPVRLFPNPVRTLLTIHDDRIQWTTAEMMDNRGRRIASISNSGTAGSGLTTNVSRLPAGIYFIRLSDRNGNALHGKFIKQ